MGSKLRANRRDIRDVRSNTLSKVTKGNLRNGSIEDLNTKNRVITVESYESERTDPLKTYKR